MKLRTLGNRTSQHNTKVLKLSKNNTVYVKTEDVMNREKTFSLLEVIH